MASVSEVTRRRRGLTSLTLERATAAEAVTDDGLLPRLASNPSFFRAMQSRRLSRVAFNTGASFRARGSDDGGSGCVSSKAGASEGGRVELIDQEEPRLACGQALILPQVIGRSNSRPLCWPQGDDDRRSGACRSKGAPWRAALHSGSVDRAEIRGLRRKSSRENGSQYLANLSGNLSALERKTSEMLRLEQVYGTAAMGLPGAGNKRCLEVGVGSFRMHHGRWRQRERTAEVDRDERESAALPEVSGSRIGSSWITKTKRRASVWAPADDDPSADSTTFPDPNVVADDGLDWFITPHPFLIPKKR